MRQVVLAVLRALNLDIDGLRSRFARGFQDLDLLLDTAGEASLVLAPPAGGQNHAVRIARQKLPSAATPRSGEAR